MGKWDIVYNRLFMIPILNLKKIKYDSGESVYDAFFGFNES